MKLLYCLECLDVVALRGMVRHCSCLQSAGRYESDDLAVTVAGPCVVLGVDSARLERAIREHRVAGAAIEAHLVGNSSERVLRVARGHMRHLQPLRRRA